MIETLQSTNFILAILGIITLVCAGLLGIDLKTKRALAPLVHAWGLSAAFIGALGATIFALVYSEYFGLVPCGFCWFERILLFPQVILLGTALWYKDWSIARYGIVLSAIGFVISLYHHYIQMGGAEFITCPTSGGSCTQRFFFEFNFMTFPLMGAIFFAFLIVLYMYILKVSRGVVK